MLRGLACSISCAPGMYCLRCPCDVMGNAAPLPWRKLFGAPGWARWALPLGMGDFQIDDEEYKRSIGAAYSGWANRTSLISCEK